MAQEKAHSLIQKAQSWQELHTGLAKVGMRYVRKGSGAVIHIGDTAVKASSVDRNFSLGKLCKLLGKFEASTSTTEIAPAPEPEPVSHIAKKEWQEYQEEHRKQSAVRLQDRARRAETERLEAEKQRHERRATLARIAPYGLSVLNIARHCMILQQQGQKAERKKQHRASHRLSRFKHWLASKNQWLAQLWRFRNRIAPDMWVKQYNFPQRSNLESPLYAFQAMVREKFIDIHWILLGWMLPALYLRCAGYKAEIVDQEMIRHNPHLTIDQERNGSFERRTRILQYAYGAAGDVDIATSRLASDQIHKFISEAKQKEQELQNAIEQQKRMHTGDPYKVYYDHANNIRQHMPRIKDSTLDAMIVLRMRSNGHSKEAITKAIVRMTSVARMT